MNLIICTDGYNNNCADEYANNYIDISVFHPVQSDYFMLMCYVNVLTY